MRRAYGMSRYQFDVDRIRVGLSNDPIQRKRKLDRCVNHRIQDKLITKNQKSPTYIDDPAA